ncbi:hypothetical protein [Roseimarinus sediminis]|uniref:hypothetical protein n=1 Tax=Roseimarinus sediminis TaxID=1610899 RepID=UPI003D1D387D
MKKESKIPHQQASDRRVPFKVPEGYFDTFAERLMEQIDAPDEEKQGKKLLFRVIRPMLAMAASFTIIFMLVYYSTQVYERTNNQQSLTQLDSEDNYFDLFHINDHSMLMAFENVEPGNEYNEEIMETYLMASVSDIELIELRNH